MKSEFANSRQFVRGAARYSDLCYIISKGKGLVQQDIAHSSAICIDGEDWADAVDTDWDSTALAVAKKPNEKLVFVGEDGDVCTYVGGQSTIEEISPPPKLIRNAKTVDGYVIVCGMLRQVYQRVNEGEWADISAPRPEAGEEVGFEAVDGYSTNELYAVGWNGEIWEYDGSKWFKRESPTNVILTSVCCAPDGTVYIGGQNGTLLKGRHESWEIIDWKDEINIDIWDLCWFNGRLYVAAINNLFTLDDNQLMDVDFGDLETPSCFCLTQAEGVMWSIGNEDVLSFDGTTWQQYE